MKHFLVGVAVLASLAACSRANTPEAVIEQFSRADETGKCDRLSDFVTKSSASLANSFSGDCKRQAEKLKSDKNAERFKAMTVKNKQEQGDRATLSVEVETTTGQRRPATFVLVKEDGAWKIDLNASMEAMVNQANASGGAAAPAAAPPAAAGQTSTTTTTTSTTTTGEGEEAEAEAEEGAEEK